MRPSPWVRPEVIAPWVRERLVMFVGFQISALEILAGMPQPRDWVFVGKTDRGPRGVFQFEIVCVWRN